MAILDGEFDKFMMKKRDELLISLKNVKPKSPDINGDQAKRLHNNVKE